LTHLVDLPGAERRSVYKLIVTYTSGYSDIGTCDTFADLSRAIDAAMAAPGFARYEVRPAGDR
jgi:hypothetical protein